MTVLIFPESSADWSQAFTNGLSQGVFCDDPNKTTFWGHYELLGSIAEDGEPVIDVFKQQHTLQYTRIPRTEKETEL